MKLLKSLLSSFKILVFIITHIFFSYSFWKLIKSLYKTIFWEILILDLEERSIQNYLCLNSHG